MEGTTWVAVAPIFGRVAKNVGSGQDVVDREFEAGYR